MKNLTKLTLIAVIVLCSTSAFAQKYGYINTQELISVMPERDSVQTKLTAYSKELGTMLESIQVELNNKYNDYQKNLATLSEAVRQLKEKELQDLQGRLEEFQQNAQQSLQKMQGELMTPVIERAEAAIKKVSKANAIMMVFDLSSGALAYYDTVTMTNVLPLVKTELGIKDTPKPAATPAK